MAWTSPGGMLPNSDIVTLGMDPPGTARHPYASLPSPGAAPPAGENPSHVRHTFQAAQDVTPLAWGHHPSSLSSEHAM